MTPLSPAAARPGAHGPIVLLLALLVIAATPSTARSNAITAENLLTGSSSSVWDVSGAGDPSIQGFATDISVNRGTTVHFKIRTGAEAYQVEIYRLGWYQGLGARHVGSGVVTATLPQIQPDSLYDAATGLTDCGTWEESAHWDVPANAVSGIYLARIERDDTQGASHIVFVVRDDASTSDLFFQTSDATWQAYNAYGGNSLYVGSTAFPAGHAAKVSYNRPFVTRGGGGGSAGSEDWVFNAEYPMVRWLEANGYDVAYTTNVDTDRDGARILQHKVFMSVGHDEYWSAGQRASVEAARNAGVHLAFLSGNEIYWKTRWEPSTDPSATSHRTLVCYKEGTLGENVCGSKCDPAVGVWTGLWRDGCAPAYPANDACLPENAVSGQISWQGSTGSIEVPDTYKSMRFWRGTAVASLGAGQKLTLPPGTLGYEWDWRQYPASDPPGRVSLSSTTLGGKLHQLSLYRHASGALVFGAGSVQWSWGLDGVHDGGSSTPSLDMQQATVNLFADMGNVQPETPGSGIVLATTSADALAPASAISSPATGALLPSGVPVTISGTASDAGGGTVAAVEVSVDGGATWHPATGTAAWTYAWTPTTQGSVTIECRGVDDSGNLGVPGGGETPVDVVTVTVTAPPPPNCPCTVFQPTDVPGNEATADGPAIEVGMKFKSSVAGYVTGVKFFKGFSNTGTHLGHLWSRDGTMLSEVEFTGETAFGWQSASFPTPQAIDADTTYVISMHSPLFYPNTNPYFTTAHVNGPLTALADGDDGPNGVYLYSPTAAFPTATYNTSNYWVDVVFDTQAGPDVTPPVVTSLVPSDGASGVATGTTVRAVFDEAMSAATVSGTTFLLAGPGATPVAASVTWNAGTRTATLTPSAALASSTTYTATLKGGGTPPRLEDANGNALAADVSWSFTTAAPPPPPPNEGPGGPILVISAASDPFSRYPVEILRAEGLNEFTAMDLSLVTPAVLADYDVVVLGSVPLASGDVTMLSDWTTAGGTLVAFRPDKQLAGLMGLSDDAATLANGYVLVQTASGPGAGICGETMQFHGTADLYSLAGATSVATLYSDATTPTAHPAVTRRAVGGSGGLAVAFTYDLARSVVYTRQGNPAWAGQKRDGQIPPTRSDDLFFGPAAGDPQPNWVDFTKIAIPQADEQQRLLANVIQEGSAHRRPLPRFWYLPRGLKAAVVMTGDDHANNGTTGRFNQLYALSPSNTAQAVADWTAIRATSYLYTNTPISDAQAAAFEAQGFEVSLHLTSNCSDWTPATFEGFAATQLADFASVWPSVPAPSTNRTHCIAWSDWASAPRIESQHGIRLDANYYYWPSSWILDRPGLFTGSGIPMRFADLDGSLIDCWQVVTQMPDESGETFPAHIDSLLERALGPRGYYGVFCANMHTDNASSSGSDAIVASALARQVPVVSARQMLHWLDGRGGSSFGSLSFTGGVLAFTMAVGAGANNLQAMLPVSTPSGTLATLTRDGNPVAFTPQTVKGVAYAFFDAAAGSWSAVYSQDTAPPAISAIVATPHGDGTATVTWTTDEASDSHVDYGTSPASLTGHAGDTAPVTSHSVTLTGLSVSTTYHFRVRSRDAALNEATAPPAEDAPLSFATPGPACPAASTAAQFALGTADAGIAIARAGDGELILAPASGTEFDGSALPGTWQWTAWDGSGSAVVGGGTLTLDGARAATVASFGPGRSLEFVATFTAEHFQHFGFVGDMDFNTPWAIFSTGSEGDAVYARTDGGTNTLVSAALLGSPHRYRIDWTATGFVFFVDGAQVASSGEVVAGNLLALGSDVASSTPRLTLDWVRVSPYATPGSWTSQAFDHGGPTLWGTASWTASTPLGTGVAVLARQGNTASPDGSWTDFSALSNGVAVGGSSRYLQLRIDLSTSDPLRTPELSALAVDCVDGSDTAPPVISAVSAVPAGDGLSATVSWTTDEPATSHVDWGTSAVTLGSGAGSSTLVTSHSVPLTGLVAGTLYHFRVTSTDLSANSSTFPASPADPLTFSTPAPACFVDRTASDFALGDASGGTYLSSIDDGEVMLQPSRASEFSSLPPTSEWDSFAWNAGGTSTVSGGSILVDGARYNSEPAAGYGPGTSMEFVATFGAVGFQHVGFGSGNDLPGGEIYNTPPAAMFSTGSGGAVICRTWVSSFSDAAIAGNLIGTPHRYRIDWTTGSIDYWVDGTLVHSETASIGGTMRPAISDYDLGGPGVSVDWIHVSPYPATGEFVSRVYDAGSPASWAAATWTADTPTGTGITFGVRRGDTSVPDGSWTTFAELGSSGAIVGGTSRYLQYHAVLTSSIATATPLLREFSVACVPCTTPTPPPIADFAVARGTGGADRSPLVVTFTVPSGTAAVEVYRAPFGGYPRYDDGGGSAPTTPAYPPGGAWTLTAVTTSGQTDDPPSRDAWSYVAFARGTCGGTSGASNRPAAVPNYVLGDVSDGTTSCAGDGLVDLADLTLLGGHYGTLLGGTEDWVCTDIGPTTDGSPSSRPLTDGALDFEDLVLFALDWTPGPLASPAAAAHRTPAAFDEVALEAPDHVEAGEHFSATIRMSGTGRIHGLSAALRWNAAIVEPVGSAPGALVEDGQGLAWSPAPGQVDAVVLGRRGAGFAGEGVLATVTFRARTSGAPGIALARVQARDAGNAPVSLGERASAPLPPAATAFDAIAPNPVRGRATLSFGLAHDGPVDLTIYGVDGRRVATLVHETRGAGTYREAWEGTLGDGTRVAPGLYFARLTTAQGRFTRSLILVR